MAGRLIRCECNLNKKRDAHEPKFEKLKALLKELFQLDQPDLDFGLYRSCTPRARR